MAFFDALYGSSRELLSNSSGEQSAPSNEASIPSIQDTELTTLTAAQRILFTGIVALLCILSVFGNFGTLYVNQKRKGRLFFRMSLISLALSDLITTLFMTVAYLTQFGAPYVQIWCLGDFMCRFIPFVTTGAILVSSMTLVGIALDRYFAVMKAVLGFWNPNKVFSIFFTICIWGLSFGIASPMYSAYAIFQVYILMSGVDRNGREELVEIDMVEMCVSDKESNAYYYIVVLAIIFLPTLVAFVWLNSIIANKLWIRRHSVSATPSPPMPTTTAVSGAPFVADRKPDEKQMEMIQQQYDHPCHCQGGNKICTYSNLTVPTSLVATTAATAMTTTKSLKNSLNSTSGRVGGGGGGGGDAGNSAKHISSREARHLRMFIVVLILMAVFIFFRLPAWIFLIMRMYGTYSRPVHWILHFSFGFLTLTSCVLNPLLYTFLAETIQYAMFVKGKLCGLKRYFKNIAVSRCYCYCCHSSNYENQNNNEKMTQNQNQNQNENQHQYANQNETNDKYNYDNVDDVDDDGTSNDGAKSTLSEK